MAHQSTLIADNIEQYLHEHENKDLLRFITCGSVDDGKSTLIGRLLHEAGRIPDDERAALVRATARLWHALQERAHIGDFPWDIRGCPPRWQMIHHPKDP